MRIVALTPSYNDEKIISGTLKCLAPFIEKHIVLISEKPYFGETSEPDKTFEIDESFGADVIRGTWALDHFQRNTGISLCKDVDWILTFDSDELMTFSAMEKLISILEKTQYSAIAVKPNIYWKTIDYVLSPTPEFTPIIAIRPKVRFNYIRNIDHPFELVDVDMHHLSWCAPKDIYKKVMHYAHATDFDGHEWYKKYYEKWDNEEYAVLPTQKYKVIKQSLPQELRNYLNGV